jgi:hypothetical protein
MACHPLLVVANGPRFSLANPVVMFTMGGIEIVRSFDKQK